MLKSIIEYRDEREEIIKATILQGNRDVDSPVIYTELVAVLDYFLYIQKTYNDDMAKLADVIEFQQKQISDLTDRLDSVTFDNDDFGK